MTSRKSADDNEGIIDWLARTHTAQHECKHGPPRSTKGRPWGIEDTCTCGATTYMLSPLRGWRYLKGKRP